MGKVLLAFVFVVGLSVTGLAANIHFAVPSGSDPVTSMDVDQAGGTITLELHADGEGTGFWGGNADFSASSTEVLPLTHVSWFGFWGINSALVNSAYAGAGDNPCLYTFDDVMATGYTDDQPIATFTITIPSGLPVSTYLTLTVNDGHTPAQNGSHLYDSVTGAPLATTFTDLVIHITPEPATLGLLVLGGLAVLRRRFA